jgi:hypothetical protein
MAYDGGLWLDLSGRRVGVGDGDQAKSNGRNEQKHCDHLDEKPGEASHFLQIFDVHVLTSLCPTRIAGRRRPPEWTFLKAQVDSPTLVPGEFTLDTARLNPSGWVAA